MSSNRIQSPSYGSREEAPEEDSTEHHLFLLEFVVKQASGGRLARLNQMFFLPTCVQFGFLDFAGEDDLQVTPVDLLFRPQAGVADDDVEIFNVGKSVLFAVDHNTVMDLTAKMILKIIVRKQMPDGIKPDILVGIGELDLSGQYAALRLETLQCWRDGIYQVFDDRVPLYHNGKPSGDLSVFVRLSSLGQTIVTELDAPTSPDDTTFVFGTEDIDQSVTYRCRKVDSCASEIDFVADDSSGDLRTCPVCVPERYPCVPCGKLGAIEDRDKETRGKSDYSETRLLKRKHTGLARSSHELSKLCGKPVVLKVSGLFDNGDGKRKPTVTIADESGAASHPDHDIFVLRIGKKGLVGVGEKSDIQLEMKTPKGPERRPPIRYETREMQTDVDEKSAKEQKKKKKKGKKK